MRELPLRADSTPTPDPAPGRKDLPPKEYPIIEPAGPFKLPRRENPTEPPTKTVPYTPGPMRFLPKPQPPGKREVNPLSPHRRPVRRAA